MPTGPTVPDTSAWVDYLRGAQSTEAIRVRELIAADAELLVPGSVLMEVLAGARTERERLNVRRFLARFTYVRTREPGDYEEAAQLYATCRARGRQLRGHADCLIAVVAMRLDAAVLHRDRDFDAIAEVAPLRIA